MLYIVVVGSSLHLLCGISTLLVQGPVIGGFGSFCGLVQAVLLTDHLLDITIDLCQSPVFYGHLRRDVVLDTSQQHCLQLCPVFVQAP